MPRFFVAPSDVSGDTVTLTGENAHHASYSLRLAPGDRIRVCDQRTAYLCEMVSFNGEIATARILSADPIDTEPPFTARLYQALPKGDKLDTVIQKAVECGVTEIIPFESSRCIVRAKPEAETRKTERRCRIAEEAAKQCGRGVIPTVRPTVTFAEALRAAGKADLALFCYEGQDVTPLPVILEMADPVLETARREGRRPEIAIFVGSEGGFSPEEAAAAREAGFAMTGLGKRILRTETASGFVLSCLIYALEL
ncbi:MAG: 16S rRNA (uracil(1498)-N(3))-methyltransferase [Clostridia bacterium]|nr:16S rRNA (uracil(1498)-N(3))-methyltransferase [Clostridia bacterium]